jgi:hypothetical protein
MHYTWDLAYGEYSDSIVTDGITKRVVKVINNPYKDKWFADPFILSDSQSTLVLLVEEFDRDIRRGRIAKIVVDKKINTIVDCKIILDLPTHLSFPAIYIVNDKIYVHPENYASGVSKLYEYDEANEVLVNAKTICDQPLTDAVICAINGKYTIYATLGTDPNGSKLSVFTSDKFDGPYLLSDTISFNDKSARMAGFIFCFKGKAIRPAQDCNMSYGQRVIFYEDQTAIGELKPFGRFSGIHTFNKLGNTFVVDLKKYDHKRVYDFITWLKK